MKRFFKLLYQKITRGWSDRDTWDLKHTITLFILPRIKRFKELSEDPNCVAGHPGGMTHKEWIIILDKMIIALAYIKWEYEDDGSIECMKKYEPQIQEGLELLGKYFNDLWW